MITESNKPAVTNIQSKLKGRRRSGININQTLLNFSPLLKKQLLPLLATPKVKGISFIQWAQNNRKLIENKLLEHGGILFRGFDIQGATEFEHCIEAISGASLEYKFRASPRTQVKGNIYTSTDYPADQPIFAHNEHAYSPVFPLRLYFYCDIPCTNGGQTPIGNNRHILKAINPEVVEKFKRKKIMYMRNYGDGFGLPWSTVFQSENRSNVEKYCQSVGIKVEWKNNNRLRTWQTGSAIMKHPQTNEPLWFNHGTFFHVTTLTPIIRDQLLHQFAEEDLPTNTYYGDGSAIEPQVLEHLRSVYRENMVTFTWNKGDLLLLDNMLTVHARTPYNGERRVLTGMAKACDAKTLGC